MIYGGVGLSVAVAGAIVFAVLQGPANPQSGSPEVIAGQGARVAPSAQGLPSPAGATNVILNQGDVVLVQGSNLLCRFKSDELKLACILTNSNGPLPHSWGTSMNIDGTVEVFQFDANGKSTTTKKFRKLLGVAAQGKIYHLKVGDRYRAGSTRIACRVKRGNSSFGRSPVAHCYYIAPKSHQDNARVRDQQLLCRCVLGAAHAEPRWDNSRREEGEDALREEAASTRVKSVPNDSRQLDLRLTPPFRRHS